jgi:hypothetical protein
VGRKKVSKMKRTGCRFYEKWEKIVRGPGGWKYRLPRPINSRGKLIYTWLEAYKAMDKVLPVADQKEGSEGVSDEKDSL